MKEILEVKKREYIVGVIHRGFSKGFKFSVLNEEEKQLVNNASDLNDLIDNIIPRIKEKQNEEESIRSEHLVFWRKVSSRLEDDLKTVEEVKKFEQEVKKHLQEKVKAKETQQIETKVLYNLSKK
ncbi:hypothetical protein C1645_819514 [Glomus cerebriforme]|uniref:Uncharacterized protein n=1 Tax=Glomus cerebriforme TaxID=658196 RepID=A0A397TAP2_9GLOM|nr:hypothetical protein C1645_819514 [Glomus cerebriforme]